MKAGKVREAARAWALQEADRGAGVVGAHLIGSLLACDPEEEFPAYRDVDICLVMSGQEADMELMSADLRGFAVDGTRLSERLYASAADILGNPMLAPSFLQDCILFDPKGRLGALQWEVRDRYAQRSWVRARCEVRGRAAQRHIDALADAADPGEAGFHLWRAIQFLTGVVALAHLATPTARRCLVVTRNLLQAAGAQPLYDRLLTLFGAAGLDRPTVEACLSGALVAFDAAVSRPVPPALLGTLRPPRPSGRRALEEGAREMIESGDHREALFWIALQHFQAMAALEAAQAEGLQSHRERAGRLLAALGLLRPDVGASRHALAQEVAAEVFALAERVVAADPRLADG